jgi:transcriptional regulator with XRE-family HTH domain
MARKREPRQLEAFGTRVRALRMHLGLSQEELADRAEMHSTYISQTERGRRNVSLTTLLSLAEALEVEPTALVAPELPEGVEEPRADRVRPGGRRVPPRPRPHRLG